MEYEKKQKIVTYICGLALIGALTGYMYMVISTTQSKQDQQLFNNGYSIEFYTDEPSTVEYGQKIKPSDFIKSSKGYVKMPKLDTYSIGTHKLKYILEVDGKTKNFYKTVIVKDTQYPKINCSKGSTFKINKGDPVPYSENDFTAEDPVDGELKCSFKGYLNTNETGDYKINVSATDKSGNKTVKTIEVIVDNDNGYGVIRDYSTADSIDDYTNYGQGKYGVREKTLYVHNDISDETLNAVIQQLNVCPQYLVDTIGNIHIYQDGGDLTVKATPVNMGVYQIDIRNINKNDTDSVLKGVLHAFYQKYKLNMDSEIAKCYSNEKTSDDNSKEDWFVNIAEKYIKDTSSILKSYPKTYKYFKEIQL